MPDVNDIAGSNQMILRAANKSVLAPIVVFLFDSKVR